MKGNIPIAHVSLTSYYYTCVHHKHINVHKLSHIHLKHRTSVIPHLSPQDPAAQNAAQAISPECLSSGTILSCLPSWMLPSQTAVAAATAVFLLIAA